ncbi:MAG: GldG family protein [Pseudomonadota bacterium]|nr:GldG family protein [Pseudomonadota bacterium]
MRITRGSRLRIRLRSTAFTLAFLALAGLTAWMSTRHSFQTDWTAGQRNTVSEETRELLALIDGPIEIVAFVGDDTSVHQRINERVERLQREKKDIHLDFVNPEREPERARTAGVGRGGKMVLTVGGQTATVGDVSERTLANALQRLARSGDRWVAFLEGHGERDPDDETNTGLHRLGDELGRGGFNVQKLNLVRTPTIPDNTALLVIASPQTPLMEGEAAAIVSYVDSGGNLLWLMDPGLEHGLDALAQELGVLPVPGMLVDANAELRRVLGVRSAAIIPVADYPGHPVTKGLKPVTLFPFATGIEHEADEQWETTPILKTLPRAWSETGSMTSDEVIFNQGTGDTAGPLAIGIAMERKTGEATQRLAVVGDSDFLANSYLGSGGNLELGVALFNWLSLDDALISVVPKTAPDTRLDLTDSQIIAISVAFAVLLPVTLLAAGTGIWFKRRRR